MSAEEWLELVREIYGPKWKNPETVQIFLKLIEDAYNETDPEITLCALNSYKWPIVLKIVLFGKSRGVKKTDWFRAASGRAR